MKRVYLAIILFIVLLFVVIQERQFNLFLELENISVSNNSPTHLRERIKHAAKKLNEPPKDAYIDRVWKKTPGRNGIKVNQTKSYEKMKESMVYNPKLLVFDETSPKVRLDQLPPAPIYRGHPEKKMVALMINVSWGTEHLPSMLQTLKKEQVRATFFLEGKWAKEHPEEVKMIREEGHLIGNHAYNHPDMAHITSEEIREQIEQTNHVLEAMTGETPKWFAPPSGSFTDEVVKIAAAERMETVLWTVDTLDWKNPTVSVMIDRVMDNIHPGAMVLMHPTESAAEGLESLIRQIKQQDYSLGTIHSLVNEQRG